MCRQGASVIQNQVLKVVPDQRVATYVVWVPILPTDRQAPGPDTLSLVTDRRATHFWDEEGRLPELFKKSLGLEQKRWAWDVYLIYPPGTRWDTELPPKPVYWQHQLPGVRSAPRLAGQSFAALLRKTLAMK
jgi:hypothetical protein